MPNTDIMMPSAAGLLIKTNSVEEEDNRDGYSLRILPERPGHYQLEELHDNECVKDSPLA